MIHDYDNTFWDTLMNISKPILLIGLVHVFVFQKETKILSNT